MRCVITLSSLLIFPFLVFAHPPEGIRLPVKINQVKVTPAALLTEAYLKKAEDIWKYKQSDKVPFYYLEEAKKMAEKEKYWDGYFKACSVRVDIHLYYERYNEAEKELKEALTEAHARLGKKHIRIAQMQHLLSICYGSKGDLETALKYSKKALLTGREITGESSEIVASCYHWIGFCHRRKADYVKALYFFKKAFALRKKLLGEYSPQSMSSTLNIGRVYYQKGDYEKAELYFTNIINNQNKTPRKRSIAHAYEELGRTLMKKGRYSIALQKLFKAKNLFNTLVLHVIEKENIDVAYSYSGIAECFIKIGNLDSAAHFQEKALWIWEDKWKGIWHPHLIEGYTLMGKILSNQGNYPRAKEYYEKAFSVAGHTYGTDHPGLAQLYNNIGKDYLNQNDRENALNYFQSASGVAVKGFNDMDWKINPPLQNIANPLGLLDALKQKATTLKLRYNNDSKSLNDLQLSFETSLLTLDLIDTLRNEYTTESVIELNEKSRNVYEETVRTATDLYQITGRKKYLKLAFEATERAKTFLMLQALRESGAKLIGGVPESLITLERDLKTDLAFYKKQLFEAEHKKDTSKTAMYQNYLFDCRRSFDSLITKLETDYPDYHRLKYDTRVTSVQDIQNKIIDEKTAFIEYFSGDSALYIFTITKNNFFIETVKKPKEIEEGITKMLRLIKNYPNTLSDYKAVKENRLKLTEVSNELYETLLNSSLKKLNKEISNLIIIPDGLLNYLPFEALTVSKNPQKYVLEDYALSYAYSATLLEEKKQQPKQKTNGKCLALAPQYPGSSSKIALRGSIHTLRNTPLADLPGARKEIRSVSKHFDGDFLFGKEASEANFKQNANRYNIIHLAMHGVTDEKSAMNAKLFFSKTTNTKEDDTLYNYELYGLKLSAELIVLSACETGLGDYVKGEGVMSLARGFMYAGGRSVLQSLWSAADEPGSILMDYFYQQLAESAPKDEALQHAKISYLQSAQDMYKHPFYWSGFVLNGDTAPLQSEKTHNRFWLTALITALTLIAAFFIFRKRLKSFSQNTRND